MKIYTEIPIVGELCDYGFFKVGCNFTKAELYQNVDKRCLIQAMMFLDMKYNDDFVSVDFTEKSIDEYVQNVKNNYTDKQSNILRSAVQYLTDAFPEKNIHLTPKKIPILVYLADWAQDMYIQPEDFWVWWQQFSKKDILSDNDENN